MRGVEDAAPYGGTGADARGVEDVAPYDGTGADARGVEDAAPYGRCGTWDERCALLQGC